MKRREFIRTASATALLPVLTRAALTPVSSPVPVIDTHTHFYDPTRPQGVPWPKPTEAFLYAPFMPDKFRAVTAPLNVVGTVVVEASPWVEDNQWLLDLAHTTPEIVGIVGNLNLREEEFSARLKRFAENPLYRGLRVNIETVQRHTEQPVSQHLKLLADRGLSLDVIGKGVVIPPTEALARALPALRIIVNHLPFPEWDGDTKALRAALLSLSKCPNVYIKVSDVVRRVDGKPVEDTSYYAPALDVLFELFGPDRVVHATNWPVSERVAPYATVQRIVAEYFSSKGRSVEERYFWRNSHSAYRWIPRGTAAHLKP